MSYLGVDLHTNSFTVCRQTKQDKRRFMTFSLSGIDKSAKTLRKRDELYQLVTGYNIFAVNFAR